MKWFLRNQTGDVRRTVQWIVAIVCLVFCWPLVALAMQTDCVAVLAKKNFLQDDGQFKTTRLNPEFIKQSQECLIEKGFPPVAKGQSPENKGIDGYLGPNTKAALDAYWKSLEAPPPKPTPVPTPKPTDALGVSYMLTQDDFKALAGGEAVMAQLMKLKNKPYDSKDLFAAAMEEAIKKVTGQVDLYLPPVKQHAEQVVLYKLTDDSFNQLRIENVPEDVLAKLTEIKNLGFPSEQDIDNGIKVRLIPPASPEKTSAPEKTPAKENATDLVKASPQEKASSETISTPEKTSDQCKTPPQSSEKPPQSSSTSTQSTSPPEQSTTSGATPSTPVDQATLEKIQQQVKEVTSYELTDASLKALADLPLFSKGIPPLLKDIAPLQGIEYPSEDLFRSAIEAKVKEATDKEAKAKSSLEVPSLTEDQQADMELIIQQGRKVNKYNADSQISWNGNSCGCVLDSLSGVTYGFYPYWHAGTEQTVNFSVMKRIAYFALTFDDQDNIIQRFHWQPDKADFIDVAREHGTKVDLVIYKNEWDTWSKEVAAKDYVGISKLTTNIVNVLKEKLDSTFFNRHKAIFSMGASSTPTLGDGITLYFENYPTDDASSAYLVKFIQELRQKLRKMNKKLYLNLVVPQGAFETGEGEKPGKGIFSLTYLSQIVPDVDKYDAKYQDKNFVDLFLVPLPEPTTQTKKMLKRQIEDLFTGNQLYKGMQRRNMLRKVVPVLMPYGSGSKQFDDDVIYLEDNFGGIGFWPLPVIKPKPVSAEDKITNEVANMEIAGLTKLYQTNNAKPPSELRKYVCVHKWTFRIAFDVLTAILLIYGVLAIFMCQLRRLWNSYTWYFLAVVLLWVGLSLGILFYDPFYSDLARGNGPLILLLAANIAYAVWTIMQRKEQAQRP